MSIRRQMALLLIALSTVFVMTTWMMQAFVTAPAFEDLEQQTGIRNLGRYLDALKSDINSVDTLASDYAAWDDTCIFVKDRNEAFRESNLTESFHETTNNDFFCIVDPAKKIIETSCIDPETRKPIDTSELLQTIVESGSSLLDFKSLDDSHQGLIDTSRGLMMIASRPILTSKREGPIRGAVLMGRLLSPERILNLAQRTRSDVEIFCVEGDCLPEDVLKSLPELKTLRPGDVLSKTHDDETSQVVFLMNDVFGNPQILVRLLNPRTISQQGRKAANAAMTCSLIGVLSMILGTGLALRLRVVEPLQKMAAHASRVGDTNDLEARLNSSREDEIGVLARSFDRMVEQLADSREKLQNAAHRAGMAEIASEVLHNIGNAVNTANCCAELVEDRLNSSRLSGLEMATLMLTEQAPRAAQFFSQDARGPKLILYLTSLNDNLQRERCENLEEVHRLRATINHIRDTIASQQSHARQSDFRQRVNLSELLQETLLVNAPLRQKTGVQVEISSSFPPDVDVFVNRSRISQVLVNLQKNALLSMQSVPDREHVLTIAVDVINSDTLEIEIRDTGIGFTSEVRDRLFSQGFTTRKSGSGLGLHYCINVLREMGGDISAFSDGPGLGASFRITVPRAIRELRGSSVAAPLQTASVAFDMNAESADESCRKEEQYV